MIDQREATIRWIEKKGAELWCVFVGAFAALLLPLMAFVRRSGECTRWKTRASRETKHLVKDVNAPLLELLAQYAGDDEPDCIDFFRDGGPLFNDGAEGSLCDCEESNRALIASLRADANEEALHKIAFDDHAKGRMSEPKRIQGADLSQVHMPCFARGPCGVQRSLHFCQVLLMPRFGIEQGTKPDGSTKVRAVDHFSWSHSAGKRKRKRSEIRAGSVNGHYNPDTDLKHDHLDDLAAAMRAHYERLSKVRVSAHPHCLNAGIITRLRHRHC